ncbi:MAG TPA: hypothetical protein EYQ50_18820 [Verrucomicrobiales bacterium]|nr:hypothetical protein [Verrucomicrobiales bacterium]
MKTIRADHLGMCFGVRDAIASAKEKSRKSPVTVYGELVHNQQVLEDLESSGITVESDLNRIQTTEVLITA